MFPGGRAGPHGQGPVSFQDSCGGWWRRDVRCVHARRHVEGRSGRPGGRLLTQPDMVTGATRSGSSGLQRHGAPLHPQPQALHDESGDGASPGPDRRGPGEVPQPATPSQMATWALPASAVAAARRQRSEHHEALKPGPEKWSEALRIPRLAVGTGASARLAARPRLGPSDDGRSSVPMPRDGLGNVAPPG